jgi:ribulose 1,5-bisphosphate carboxylase large subunit-like protein
MAEAVRRAIEAVAAGQPMPSEAETVLKLLEALRGALINQRGEPEVERFDRILGEF